MSQKKATNRPHVFSSVTFWIILCVLLAAVCLILALQLRSQSSQPGQGTEQASGTLPIEAPTRNEDLTADGENTDEYTVQCGEMVPMTARRVGNSQIWEGTDGEGQKLMFVIDEDKNTYSLLIDGVMTDQGNYNGQSVMENMDVLLLESLRFGAFAVPVEFSRDGTQMYLSLVDNWLSFGEE